MVLTKRRPLATQVNRKLTFFFACLGSGFTDIYSQIVPFRVKTLTVKYDSAMEN